MTAARAFPPGSPEWKAAPPPPPPPPTLLPDLPNLGACEYCGQPFSGVQPDQKYCSKQHARAAHKTRNKRRKKGLLPAFTPAEPKKLPVDKTMLAAMIAAARRAANDVGIMEPYGASIRDYIRDDGTLDTEALHAADADAEAENIRSWTVVIQAAINAIHKKE